MSRCQLCKKEVDEINMKIILDVAVCYEIVFEFF